MSDTCHQRFHNNPLDCITHTPPRGWTSKSPEQLRAEFDTSPPKNRVDAYGNPIARKNIMKDTLKAWLDSRTPEQLLAELDKRKHLQMVNINGKEVSIDKVPWWRKDKYGWPIETVKGKYLSNFFRITFQNVRKILFL